VKARKLSAAFIAIMGGLVGVTGIVIAAVLAVEQALGPQDSDPPTIPQICAVYPGDGPHWREAKVAQGKRCRESNVPLELVK